MNTKMFYKASSLIFERAKELRANLTSAEMILWGYLKSKPLGYKFRRQHPINTFIVDFFCYKLKLVIEVDGSIHDRRDVKLNDGERQKLIESEDIQFLRFTNDEVIKRFETVIERIQALLINDSQIRKLTIPL